MTDEKTLEKLERLAKIANVDDWKEIDLYNFHEACAPADVLALIADSRKLAAVQWQSIETAPKDTEILIGWFDDLPGVRTPNIQTALWSSYRKRWCNSYVTFTDHPASQPTHWMKLPDPPSIDQPAAEIEHGTHD